MGMPGWVVGPRYQGEALTSVWFAAAQRCGLGLPSLTGDPWPVTGAELAGYGAATGSPAKGVVVVMADGLGLANLEGRRGHAPGLWSMDRAEWRCGFPSTTVASLGSFGTGRPPGMTGLAGYALRDPATGQRATLIKWDTPTKPEVWQPIATVFERLAAVCHPVSQVGEARFAQSAMTQSSLRGGVFHGTSRASQRLPKVLQLARDGAELIYLYWGELDKAAHRSGWTSEDWSRELEELDLAVRGLLAGLAPGWEVWLVSDHGVVDAGQRWDVATEPVLAQGVALVAGEARAVHLYCDPVDSDQVAARWAEHLGEAAWVLTRRQAIDHGLFGTVSARVEPYLGDVIVAMAGTSVVVDSRYQSAQALQMVGQHGSLTAQEMTIPLLRATV